MPLKEMRAYTRLLARHASCRHARFDFFEMKAGKAIIFIRKIFIADYLMHGIASLFIHFHLGRDGCALAMPRDDFDTEFRGVAGWLIWRAASCMMTLQ